MLSGLSSINIELQSRCDKQTFCAFCGRQDPKTNPIAHGRMDFGLLKKIRYQLPEGIVIQFHRDGEPTAYPFLGLALCLFEKYITSIVTHGENLAKKAHEIIGHCTTITVSAFKGDPDVELQYESVSEFLSIKGDRPPMVNIKVVGVLTPEMETRYGALGVPIIRRVLHVPDGNYKYAQRQPTIPEHQICLDFLHHPSIDYRGRLYICNRLDPEDRGLLGDLTVDSLDTLWNSEKRKNWLEAHKRGRRDIAAPLCWTCKYYGVPTGP